MVRLGFMGVFVQAVIQALREFPAVNAEIDGTDIIYKNYYTLAWPWYATRSLLCR